MKEKVVLDTSFLVAYLCQRDIHHRRALEVFEKLLVHEMVIPDIIWGETVSVVARRAKEWKFEFRDAVKRIKIMCPHPAKFAIYFLTRFDDVLKLVEETNGELNFNDALIVIGASEEGIEKIATFDKDFERYMKVIG